MSRSGGGDSSINSDYYPQFALDTVSPFLSLQNKKYFQSDHDDSTIREPSDATSYNPLPNVKVPRSTYIPDDLEKSLDALDGFKLAEPVMVDSDDTESILTEGKLLEFLLF